MRSTHVHAARSSTTAVYAPKIAPAPDDPLARLERAGPRALEGRELLALIGVLDDPDASPRNFLFAREDRTRVLALLDLHLRWMGAHHRRDGPLTSPEATRCYLTAWPRAHPFEVFVCLLLDNRHRVTAFEALYRGTVGGVSVYPREAVCCALRHNAVAVSPRGPEWFRLRQCTDSEGFPLSHPCEEVGLRLAPFRHPPTGLPILPSGTSTMHRVDNLAGTCQFRSRFLSA